MEPSSQDRVGSTGTGSPEIRSADRAPLPELSALFVRNRRILLGLPLLVAVCALAFSFVMPRRYTVESRFMPETGGGPLSRMSGLAAQFGIDVGGSETGESIDFYAELLESQDLLRNLVLTEFRFALDEGTDSLAGNLVDLMEVDGDTPAERVRNAVERMKKLVTARPDPGANLVTLRTSAGWPELAVQVNRRLLELVNEFNLERRQSRAASERRFLETRVEEAASDLRAAEAEMERFLSENRRYSESPQLTFELGRLQRRVELRQQLHMSLAQAYEQARVDEVRNTPVITVIDHPHGPAKLTSPRLLVNAAVGLILGLVLAVTLVLVRDYLDSSRQPPPGGARV